MAKLDTIQQWAERYAQKLELPFTPKVRWANAKGDPLCNVKTAHCHISNNGKCPEGTICINPKHLREDHSSPKEWRWLIAHEVCHLKVKSHSSPYFDRYMALLGFAQEKRQAQVAGLLRHRHDWLWSYPYCNNEVKQHCRICNAERTGTITWGKTNKN